MKLVLEKDAILKSEQRLRDIELCRLDLARNEVTYQELMASFEQEKV